MNQDEVFHAAQPEPHRLQSNVQYLIGGAIWHQRMQSKATAFA
ncbi:hypothetical protein [Steroidobacter denitrificans]|nr:hypothetical protein [Steroidobacter denitrificans]